MLSVSYGQFNNIRNLKPDQCAVGISFVLVGSSSESVLVSAVINEFKAQKITANKSLAHQRDFYLIWVLFYLSVVSVPNLVLNTVIVMGKKVKFSEAGHIRRNDPQLLLTNGRFSAL